MNQSPPTTLKVLLASTNKILPIITEELTAEQALFVAEAVYKGGARAVEFCLRTQGAENTFISKKVFDQIHKYYPGMKIGVGTIQKPEDFDIAKAAGADFTVSATYSEKLIESAKAHDIPFVPNIFNAQMVSDIMLGEGGRTQNFEKLSKLGITGFKVSALASDAYASTGNANAILAIMGNRNNRFPENMSIICTEGVFGLNQFNLTNFPFNHPRAAGVGGTWMWQQIDKDTRKPYSLIQNGEYHKIMQLTALSIQVAQGKTLAPPQKIFMEGFAGTRNYAEQTGQAPRTEREGKAGGR